RERVGWRTGRWWSDQGRRRHSGHRIHWPNQTRLAQRYWLAASCEEVACSVRYNRQTRGFARSACLAGLVFRMIGGYLLLVVWSFGRFLNSRLTVLRADEKMHPGSTHSWIWLSFRACARIHLLAVVFSSPEESPCALPSTSPPARSR